MKLKLPTFLAIAFLSAPCAHAASVIFTIELTGPVPAGMGLAIGDKYSGTITYSATVPTTGIHFLTPAQDPTMTLDLSFLGNSYDETDDDLYPGGNFPIFRFVNGEVHGIDFYAANKHSSSDADGYVGIQSDPQKLYYGFNADEEFEGNISWPANPYPVPEPSSAILLSICSLTLLRRKRSPSA